MSQQAEMDNNKKTSLLSLPDELLIDIITYVAARVPDKDDTPTITLLANLSGTCRLLHRVTRDILYCKVSINMRKPAYDDNVIHLLVDTLAGRPELRHLIKSVSIQFPDKKPYPVPRRPSLVDHLLRLPGLDEAVSRRMSHPALCEGHSDAAGAHLIALLPNLERMYLRWPGAVCRPKDASLSSLRCYIFDLLEAMGHPASGHKFHGFPALQDLTLDFSTLRPHIRMSGALLLLPSLRKLGLGKIQLNPSDEWVCPPSASLVEDLTMVSFRSSLCPEIPSLFQSFAHLKHVRIERDITDRWDTSYSNNAVFAALNTQKHALETIEYTVLFNSHFPGHRTPMLDLRGFSNLRELTINDTSLFNKAFDELHAEQDLRQARYHVCMHLPSSLEEITHLTRDEDDGRGFHEARVAWWRSFWGEQRNRNHFPHLKRITVALWLEPEKSYTIL